MCLTGDFAFGSKEEVSKIIEEVGGIVDKNVKKTTNYVVVGSRGSENWKAGNYGAKIQKALEYNNKGGCITIVEEKVFIPMAMCCEKEPPMRMEPSIDSTRWQYSVQSMLEDIIDEKELPDKSLYLMTNYARDGKKITSFSVCPSHPSANSFSSQ